MKLSFHIQLPNIKIAAADLFIKVSSHGLSYTILHNGFCKALVVYHFDGNVTDEHTVNHIHQVLKDQPLLQEQFNKVYIIYGYAPFLLVPQQFIDGVTAADMLELLHGSANETITRTDVLQERLLHNLYNVPSAVDQAVNRYFGAASFTHFFSLLPGLAPGEQSNSLYCVFSKGNLKTMLVKEGKLQIMQSYTYITPEDVAYYLHNLCKSFEIAPSDIAIRLSGMIDENSPLYAELYKYFLKLEFDQLPAQYQYPPEINQYPPHYFSHLFAIASCV